MSELESFIRELKSFDWDFDSSDDFIVWREARKKHRELDTKYRMLSDDEKLRVIDSLGWRGRLDDASKYVHIDDAVTARIMRNFW